MSVKQKFEHLGKQFNKNQRFSKIFNSQFDRQQQIQHSRGNLSNKATFQFHEQTGDRKWKLLHQLFSDQAKKTPEAIAIEDRERKFTYKELDEISDRLAGKLQNMGVRRNQCVGIYMERSLEYIISYIAILKAGGGYLPIEMNNPVENVKKMLRTAECKYLISKESFQANMEQIKEDQPEIQGLNISQWDFQSQETPYQPQLVADACLDDLAFVVLSSGSTGTPKGISAPHRASVHGYLERQEFYQYKVGDRVGCNVFFVWEILRPLLNGGTVIPIPENVIFDPNLLLDYIEDFQLSEILFTPSLLEAIISNTDQALFLKKTHSMKTYWLNGEPVKSQLKYQLINLLPKTVNIFNTYSISECHDVSNENLRESFDCASGFVTCGKPVEQVEVLLLDLFTQEKISQTNVEGELLIGGPGVANGYLNGTPEQNECFPVIDGKKYFRTGDIAVILDDKRFEIKGRCNTKVKLRGYTIFLGVVEKTLNSVLNLQSSICVLDALEQKLTAYLIPGRNTPDYEIDSNGYSTEIRDKLKEVLPEYSIPQYFMKINEFPINILSGKADKKKLPPPPYKNSNKAMSKDTATHKHKIQQIENPSSLSYEQQIEIVKKMWAEILEIEPETLSGNSNFFDIGGHSLIAVQAIVYYEHVFGAKLEVSMLYEFPQVKDFVYQANLKRKEQKLKKQEIQQQQKEERQLNTPEFIKQLHADSQIVNNLRFQYNDKVQGLNDAKNVLVTGTTGFLGCFIMFDVLANSQCEKVYCLVRGKDQSHGFQRIIKNLKYYGLYEKVEKNGWLNRIVPVLGDISKSQLGVDEYLYKEMCQNIDQVYHAAAAVNFIQPYKSLKPATVDGTENILRFCSQFSQNQCSKHLFFISTNGILPPKYDSKFIENKEIDAYLPFLVNDGYGQSKWVAEKMVWNCEKNGLKASAFRLGNVGHVVETGAKNPIDFQSQLIESCSYVQAAPDCADWKLEASPVDFISNSVVNLSKDINNYGKVYHIIETNPVYSLEVFKMLQQKGYIEKIVPFEEWKEKIAEGVNQHKRDTDKYKYHTLLSIKESLDDLQKYLTDSNKYEREQTRSNLEKIGVNYVSVEAEYYEKILNPSIKQE